MNKVIATLLFLAGLIISQSCKQNPVKEIVTIPDGKVGLIGYGSLTSKKQMESQLGKKYEGPIRVIHLEDYQRYWNFIAPNDLEHPPVNNIIKCTTGNDTIIPETLVALNIQETDGKSMNCCFFIIDEEDLAKIDITEKGYKRIDVSESIREFQVDHGKVYAYQALPEYHMEPTINQPNKNAIVKLYLGFLNTSFENLGEEYKREFEESTANYHASLELDCYLTTE